jgi:hypothetical protein
VRRLVTALVIVGTLYAVYNFTMAAYGWFQMSNIVDEVARPEATRLGSQQQSGFGGFESRDRFGGLRERILKGAKEIGVPLRPDNVNVNVVDNMLDVRLSWEAPMVEYQGKTYLEVPMTVQRGFPIRAP